MMKSHELIEMASLDAMGLLDPEEREAFERAFRAADPAVQAQIRREQLRLAGMDDLLPEVEAPLGLKARVMAAWREAVAQVSGRKGDVVGRISDFRPATGVNRYWRAAAIGCAAAALVFGFANLLTRSDIKEIEEIAQNQAVNAHLIEYGRQFDRSFFDHNTKFVKFSPAPAADAEPGPRGKATLLFDPSTHKAHLLCKDLPGMNGTYEVVVVDQNGNQSEAVLTFKASNAGVIAKTIENLDLENARTLVIRQQGATAPLLSSNGL